MKPHPLVHTFRTLDEKPDLAKAQELVGGNVEIIEIPMHHPEAKYDYIQILVNEEALLLPDMEYNPVATELVLSKTKTLVDPRGVLGPAIILSGEARWK
jgi:hypothetical protein|tara:strand:- start:282 stop:578 length:297 start_codon:yes stop_codon:yes gene_type:complete